MLGPLGKNVSDFWQQQSNFRRIAMITLGVSIAIIIPLVFTWANTPTYAVAFSGLSDEDAASIVQLLEENGTKYQLKSGNIISVPSDEVYNVRLEMAAEGLPQSSTIGFEIFDENTLGMTEFTQKVNYQRALEGELEKTIGSLDSVASVQVHVVTPEKSLLSENQSPTTASVTLDVKKGEQISQSQVKAITYLVAGSVEGMTPENVTIVDTNGNLLASGIGEADNETSLTTTDSQRSTELAAASEIEDKVQDILDSVLGPDKSVVHASVVMDWTQKETTSQSYAPDPTAVRSQNTVQEMYSTDGTTVSGIPGAASNLPTPVATSTGTANSNVLYSRAENTVNYEMNQVESHEVVSPGKIERISLSVMVDGISDTATLDSLKSAVSAAAGIDETRGDTVAVETMSFDRTYSDTQEAELTKSEQTDMYIRIGQYVALALALILVLLYVTRLFRNLRVSSAAAWTPILKPVSEMASLSAYDSMGTGALMSSISSTGQPSSMPELTHGAPSSQEPGSLPEIPARLQQQTQTPEDEQMQRVVSRLAEESPASVAEIISLWLTEDEK